MKCYVIGCFAGFVALDEDFNLLDYELFPHSELLEKWANIQEKAENPEENRKYFRQLKQLSVDIAKEKVDNVNMSILSMGMTNDYEVAIEEGATMVRVGTGIFGARNYNI